MKKPKLLLLVFVVFLFSCIKKDPKGYLQSSSWEIVKIKKSGESVYTFATSSYILDFTSRETYALKLDVNSCFSGYSIGSLGNIAMDCPGCTKICCDSDFAMELLVLLPKMSNFYIIGNDLFLEGQGEIVLRKKQ